MSHIKLPHCFTKNVLVQTKAMAYHFVVIGFIIISVFSEIKGQCTPGTNGYWECVKHCLSGPPCVCADTGEWTGSPQTFCQKRNIVAQAYSSRGTGYNYYDADETVDGDISTYLDTYRGNQPNLYIIFKPGIWRIRRFQVVLDIENLDSFKFNIRRKNSNEDCYEKDVIFSYERYAWNITCSRELLGDALIIYNTDNNACLKVYEVIVQSCASGTYGENCEYNCPSKCPFDCSLDSGECNTCIVGRFGSNCDQSCPIGCNRDRCKKNNGECLLGCKSGYYGSQCSPCTDGRYGNNCFGVCSEGCSVDSCHHVTGECSSCKYGYSGIFCSKCTPGRFGFNCANACNYCQRSNCDNFGLCQECIAGRYGSFCNRTCPSNCDDLGSCNIVSGKCYSCVGRFYGSYCNLTCNDNCSPPGTCNIAGTCTNGCVDGWVGDKCDQECHFNNCAECQVSLLGFAKCSKCKDGWFLSRSVCERCPENCTSCKSDSMCSVCVKGRTGTTCSDECNSSCQNRTCDIKGTCDSGCIPGYYGQQCSKRCSDMCMGGFQECSSNDGSCIRGCTNRTFGIGCNLPCRQHCLSCYSYNNCTKCEDGHYGKNCWQCPDNCLLCKSEYLCSMCLDGFHGTRCEKECPENCASCSNGTVCLQCESGWTGRSCECNTNCSDECGENGQCKSGCKDGLYGVTCENTCPSQDCESCDQMSGNCSVCISGKYGQQCDKFCNNNCLGSKCYISGECLQGCVDGFSGDACALEVGSPMPVYVVGGVLSAVSLLVILAVIVICTRRLRNAKQSKEESRRTPIAMSALQEETRIVYENMNVSNRDNSNSGVIKSQKEEKSLYASRGSYALLIELDPNSVDNPGTEDITDGIVQQAEYYNVQVKRIAVTTLSDVIHKKKENDEFQSEFENLPQGLTESHTEAVKKKNKKRNRYKKIYPYDFNRVKLTGDGGGDYINASSVHGFCKENAYIAAQGPFTEDTLVDFWRMIWQEKIKKIVMLTNLVEGEVRKCWKYWPDEKEKYGSYEVSIIQSTTYKNCVVRILAVKKKTEQVLVNHFHFTAWPDKDVPKSASTILDFRHKVVSNESSEEGPTLVHCSAGIGRTGTYIALDYLLREGEQDGSVDILNCLTTLRRQRTQFVQTVEQYEFLHDALLEGLTMKNTSVEVKDFPALYSKLKTKNPQSGKTYLKEQYDDMNKMITHVKEGDFVTAKLPQNRKKNRYTNILAADSCRFFVPSSGDSDYINAIAIPGYNKTDAFALTQMPLPDTIEDFWNLVLSQSMTTIVMMNTVKMEKDPNIYWPVSGSTAFGKINIELLDETITKEAYKILKLRISKAESNECLIVKQFQCLFWPDEKLVPDDTGLMIRLLEEVNIWQRKNDNSTIVVHCLDGAKKSGLFCALVAIIECLKAEQTVNVVRIVSQMRNRRQQIVSSQEQLEFCYDVVDDFLEMSNTYTNV